MSFNQRIKTEVVPADSTWIEATPADRLAFFRQAGVELIILKRAELASAIGSNGRRMAARKQPRPDKANGPVLTPHREVSRTSRLMATHATVESVTLYWRAGVSKSQRLPWGTILGFHAAGQVRGAPVRDVRLSKRGIGQLKVIMAKWWEANHAPRLRQARTDRIAAEEAARKAERKRRPGIAAKAKRAMAKQYSGLAAYFRVPGEGFR